MIPETIAMRTRRAALGHLGAAALAISGLGTAAGPASADLGKLQKRLKEMIGDREPVEGKVTLEMPQIAENGQTVPLTITVDSPMTAESYCKSVHVLAEGNPEPGVCSFNFSPMNGQAAFSTRMRMAQTQNVWAVAEMSDGSVFMTKTEVKVTIGGCGG